MSTWFEQFERTGWLRRSGTYDEGFGRLASGAHGPMLDLAGLRPSRPTGPALLLDVGCGTGRLAAVARARGAGVVAADAVREMVAHARRATSGAVCAALPHLPFADAAFDAVLGAFVVNHVADPAAALAELARVTRPGGRVVLSAWDADARNAALGVIAAALAEAGVDPAAIPAGPSAREHYAAPAPFAALLAGAGLTQVRIDRCAWTHRVVPGRWWEDLLGGTVRTAGLVEAQDPTTRARIRTAFDRLIAPHIGPDGVAELPAAALLAVGLRAGCAV
ncbi:class I SAM-dependent methyltransferase [Pseudonocardia sp. H11422]|uniref:class I SAM-dependent methyltransferase n=1 Tax=Pseudonocardia sp. H11422 TaxID=2835866 RepID=UPI001BDC38F1|nr:class I SAM-dependent methyltransferase [Pseudonocardia sp. H11422]